MQQQVRVPYLQCFKLLFTHLNQYLDVELLHSIFYLIGFPAYLAAGLGQAPAMYGYGGHQLEDLAALQRSTLAASLPQLVGNASGQGGNNPNTAKGVRLT